MRARRNADDSLRSAERRFKAESTDRNYRKLAKESLRAGKPLVKFSVVEGGSIHEPIDPGGKCVWIAVSVSGRALEAGSGIEDHEWVQGNLVQMPASMAAVAGLMAGAMNNDDALQFERWPDRVRLRLTATDYRSRVEASAGQGSFAGLFHDAGFELWHTGGGCTAWGLTGPDRHAMITGANTTVPMPGDPGILLGVYHNDDADGDWIEELAAEMPNTPGGAREAIARARRAVGLPPRLQS